ncbi:AmmeMemoRadiSam system protein B [Desulfuromonas carbonis]|uniref:AmmeMemoRadiSam system protein B n=1 Tax=Desulfuromonas sp. DDH964 TaxID=1823759 RepID=UPI00078BCB61|nr:AmmeMemoRadiSam system protein B [Desulfuromonas sp. DDH964]AMV72347.1 MEMO-like protein [Desulfuromonas sp. DDH964]
MLRQAAVAGQFYNSDPLLLRRQILELTPEATTRQALGIVSPHAGYIYSGAIAAETFARVAIPDRVVIIGPNHHGFGHPAAIYADGSWETPLGKVHVDADFAGRLLQRCPQTGADSAAHRFEHSLEVQVPFLQVRNPGARIVPLCLGHLPLTELLEIGEGLATLIAEDLHPTLIVVSSDMTHYEAGEIARGKDQLAIDCVLALDPEGLYRTVRERRISMCGVLPTVVLLAAARVLGATGAELIRYGNSGDVTGDQQEVVGYAGLAIWPAATS